MTTDEKEREKLENDTRNEIRNGMFTDKYEVREYFLNGIGKYRHEYTVPKMDAPLSSTPLHSDDEQINEEAEIENNEGNEGGNDGDDMDLMEEAININWDNLFQPDEPQDDPGHVQQHGPQNHQQENQPPPIPFGQDMIAEQASSDEEEESDDNVNDSFWAI
uniref:Uncharacterized protein n=1 Tax=Panagrolaimus sp. ES5 TaxID=591445 RepID=A0AC34FQK3_9BILA